MSIELVAICKSFECSPKAMELAMQCTKPSEFIAGLRAGNMGPDAVQSLSRMMPKEKAVAWAEQSARLAGEKSPLSPDEIKALDAAKAWSSDPTETTRAGAEEAAAKLPADSPAMWAANAAAFSSPMPLPSGAISPLPVAMSNNLTAQMAAGSVQLAAAKTSPGGIPQQAMLKKPQAPQIQEILEMPKAPQMPTTNDVELGAMELAKESVEQQQAQATKQLDPFLDLGMDIAGFSS